MSEKGSKAETNRELHGAILLAGGQSRRMGQDKALLLIEGQTLLARNIALLETLVGRVVVVVDRAGRYELAGGREVVDLYPDTGPLGGLLTGLKALEPGNHLAVACDMPALHPAVLRYLLEAADKEDAQGHDALVPWRDGQPEPLCAVYRPTALPKLQAVFNAGERSLRRALRGLNARVVAEEELRPLDPVLACFTNWNTPEDVQGFSARYTPE